MFSMNGVYAGTRWLSEKQSNGDFRRVMLARIWHRCSSFACRKDDYQYWTWSYDYAWNGIKLTTTTSESLERTICSRKMSEHERRVLSEAFTKRGFLAEHKSHGKLVPSTNSLNPSQELKQREEERVLFGFHKIHEEEKNKFNRCFSTMC